MDVPALRADPGLCPLCGQGNGCAMEAARAGGSAAAPCWCAEVAFTPQLLARIPAAARRLACVCRACATAAPIAPEPIATAAGAPPPSF